MNYEIDAAVTHKYNVIKNAYNSQLFSGSHKIHTPRVLVEEILEQIPELSNNKRVLVLFNLEFVVSLVYTSEVNSTDITFYSDNETKSNMARKIGVNVIETLEHDMKFDVVVGNPPFSRHGENKQAGKRGEELYIKFYYFAKKWARTVAMIMPRTNDKLQRKHNQFLDSTANKIINIDSSVFGGIVMPMWYVLSIEGSTEKHSIQWKITNKNINGIKWAKGKVNMTAYRDLTNGVFGTDTPTDTNNVTLYHKINETRGLVKYYTSENLISKSHLFPSSGYAVLMPQTFSDRGWTKVEIVECNGKQAAFNGMNIVFLDTHDQALKFVEFMNTEEFIKEGMRVRQGFNNMTISCLQSMNLNYDDN